MNAAHISSQFARLGARVFLRPLGGTFRDADDPCGVRIDVGRDREGEFFDVRAGREARLEVVDVRPRERHLLLLARSPSELAREPEIKDKFLCGHDERHWFVAGVPNDPGVSGVASAMRALKPPLVASMEHDRGSRRTRRRGRKTDVFLRQGEWFFVEAPLPSINPKWVLRNEPISRGRGKPHLCEFLYRLGGETVYVSRAEPTGITADEFRRRSIEDRHFQPHVWRTMVRDPMVFARGKISHPDHATIRLDDWRRVVMNTEQRSRAMKSVVFLD